MIKIIVFSTRLAPCSLLLWLGSTLPLSRHISAWESSRQVMWHVSFLTKLESVGNAENKICNSLSYAGTAAAGSGVGLSTSSCSGSASSSRILLMGSSPWSCLIYAFWGFFPPVSLFWEHSGIWEPRLQMLCRAHRDASAGMLGWAGIGSVPNSLTAFVWVFHLFQIQFWCYMDLNYWFIISCSGVCSDSCCESSSTSDAVCSCSRLPSMRAAASPTLGFSCLRNCFVRPEILRDI